MNKTFWRGFLYLNIIYFLVWIFFYEAPYLEEIPRKLRHIIKFVVLISVYFIGSFHLKNNAKKWMFSIWHLIHISGILLISFCGLFDWLVSPINFKIREFLLQLNEFLIAPVLFVVMAIFANLTNNKN
jgi:hypothetical protein